jgi:hypothetical protein
MNSNLIGNQMNQNYKANLNYQKNQINNNSLQQNNYQNNIQIIPNYNQINLNYNKIIATNQINNIKSIINSINFNYNKKIKNEREYNIIKEVNTGQMIIPIKTINKVRKSICKIYYEINNIPNTGTGFFILLNNNLKFLITNYHVISKELLNIIINIEIYNNKKINIKLNNRYYKFYDKMDITIIEIKESDNIIKDIDFLYYDLNYKIGYEQYLNSDIFTIQYPKGKESYSNGKIIKIIKENNRFMHNIKTDYGSSGCPIIIPYTLKVIEIHIGGDIAQKNKLWII